ncbi:hypothetical protein NHJ13051_004471 [Beauveria bassiana]
MASSGAIPAYEPTSLDDITASIDTIRKTFRTNKTKDVDFRIRQIRKLYWGVADNAALIEEALMKDLSKCKFEAQLSEIDWIKNEAVYVSNSVKKWAKDKAVDDIPFQYWALGPKMRSEPYGTILIIGAFNYPFQLNLAPVIGAIAAGNTVLLKPSELSPHSAMVLKKIFDEYLDPDCYVCVNGNVDETKHIMEHKFDKIVFTGGKGVGTIIAKKAAETLTPYILELGGQNPSFVTRNADVKLAAKRLMWQKTFNAGQVCLSHNYVLIERPVLNEFVAEINKLHAKFMPHGADKSPDWSRIVNINHFNRLKRMLDNTKGKIVMGGNMWEDKLIIEPTAVLVDSIDDSMMVEESFGPIWSILPFDTLDEAIDIANKVDPTPLSLTTFGSDAENEKILLNVTSGGATINDGFWHAAMNQTPIGGVGSSGQGNYHGAFSFKAFSHERIICKVPKWADLVLKLRYMPYDLKELARTQALTSLTPNFDRDGNPKRGLFYWISFLFTLGGRGSKKSSILRWAILMPVVAYLVELRRAKL